MKLNFLKIVLVLALVVGIVFDQAKVFAEMNQGDPVPIVSQSAKVKPGTIAPELDLFDLDKIEQHIKFKGVPTVMISVRGFNDVEKLKQLQKLYDKRKGAIKFFLITQIGGERTKEILLKNGLTMPVLLESNTDILFNYDKTEFMIKYNQNLSSMVIVDKKGIVRYNSTSDIDVNSLDSYIDKLIKGKTKEDPILTYVPPKKIVNKVPLLNIGDVIRGDEFKDLDGAPVQIKYTNKPTVFFFWMSFTYPHWMEQMIPDMQTVNERKGKVANFYTVNGSGDRKSTQLMLDKYGNSVPALISTDNHFLWYTHVFPKIVIIDRHGILRYRPDKLPTAGELEALLDGLLQEK